MRLALRRTDAAAHAIIVDGSNASPVLMARVMAALFAAGGALAFSVAVFPRPEEAQDAGFYAIGAFSFICAALLHLLRNRIPAGALPFFVAAGTVCVSFAIWFSPETRGGPAADIEILYLWGTLYSAYFLTRAQLVPRSLASRSATRWCWCSGRPRRWSPHAGSRPC